MEICNSVPIDGAGKTRSPYKGKRKWNAITSEYAVPVAELCPTLVSQYIEGSVKKKRCIDELTTSIRQYVCHLGWTIEFLYDSIPRYRYISPEGKIYMSLRQVCIDLYGTLSPAYPKLHEPSNHVCQGKELNSSANPQLQEPLKHMSEKEACLDMDETLCPAYHQLQEPLNHVCLQKEVNSAANPQPPESLNQITHIKELNSSADPQLQEPLKHTSETEVCLNMNGTLCPAYHQLQEPLNHVCLQKEVNSAANPQPPESLNQITHIKELNSSADTQIQEPLKYTSETEVCLNMNGTLCPAYHQLQDPLNHVCPQKVVNSVANPQPPESLNHMAHIKELNSCADTQLQEPLKHASEREVCLDMNGTLCPAYHQLQDPLNHVCQQKEVNSAANPQPPESLNRMTRIKEQRSSTNSQPQEPSKHMSEEKVCFALHGTLSPDYPQLQEPLKHLCQVKEVKSSANPQELLNHMSQKEEVNSSAYSQVQESLNHISRSKEANSSANTQPQEPLKYMSQRKEVNSSVIEVFYESERCSEAIMRWYEIGGDRYSVTKEKRNKAISKAKGHLAACGWKFFLMPKGNKCELRYVSPEGKWYISLRMACEGFLEGQGSSGSAGKGNSGSAGKGNSGSLDSRESRSIKKKKNCKAERSFKKPVKGITRSSRRAKDFCVHDSSHRSPKTVLSLLIENEMVLPGETVRYLNKKDSRAMGVGEITSTGIKCNCCGIVYGLSAFEAHCGSTYHRPAANIFLDDGKSLMDCQMQIVHKRNALKENVCQKLNGKQYPNNDGTCAICHYGGELLLCDECPSSFHKRCIGLKDTPEGDWFCPSCCCKICGNKDFHEDTGQSNGHPALSCYQCEHKYHWGCLQLKRSEKLEVTPKKWFCSKTCEKIFSGLRSRLGTSVSVVAGVEDLTWTLLRSRTSDYCQDDSNDIEMLTESYSKLNVALEVIHECFEPMKNFRTGRDVADDVIFSRGSNQARVNFQGFYTVVLQKNEELITVASFRVHGEKVAELPLICTRYQYRGRGMCKLLMNELETILGDLGIERLILPAATEVLSTWTTSFGFSKMTKEERLELLDYMFLDFRDTIMCQKFLGKKESIG